MGESFKREDLADGVTLYCGDWLDVLPTLEDNSVDAVVTDPPYGDGSHANDHAVTKEDYQKLISLAPCTALFGYPERMVALCVALQVTPAKWITWYPPNKPNNTDRRCPLIRVQESVAVFGLWNKAAVIRRERSKDCKRIARTIRQSADPDFTKAYDVFQDSAPGTMFNWRLRQHPNEKPVSLMVKLVSLASTEGQTIFDPFMGSGTTGVACVQTGRRFIGIEIDEGYYTIARKRISEALMQTRMPLEVMRG